MRSDKTPIFVDILNYCEFFIADEKMTWDAMLGVIARRVKKLCLAAEAGGYALNIFIDDGYATHEAQSKWRSRKMDECRSSAKRRVPVGWTQLLGELFTLAGVPVHYSICDNDDTIAAHAIRSSSRIVVSRDSDFFRYRPRLLRIFSHFFHRRFFDTSADAHVDHVFATRFIVAEILTRTSTLLDLLGPTLSDSTQEAISALQR